jgi:hypothetical protein
VREHIQFCIGLENRPGMLARLCEVFKGRNVNIEALCVTDDTDCVWVNVIASPAETAEQVLVEGGFRFFSERVVTLQLDNAPGELGRVAAKLADAGVNINYVYGAGAEGHPCNLVLNVSNSALAMKALEDLVAV